MRTGDSKGRSEWGERPREVTDHLERCNLGPARCEDCAFGRLPERYSLLPIARAEAEKVADRLDPFACVYCDADADQIDHLLPKPWTGPALRRFVPVVPACGSCNRLIGTMPDPRLTERAAHVAASLRRKHRKFLRRPAWTDDELAELGPRLRVDMRAQQVKRDALILRLTYLDLVADGWYDPDPCLITRQTPRMGG